MAAMPTRALARQRHALTPLIAVTAAAAVFAVLLILVRLHWPPLESADHGAAASINSLIAGHAPLVAVVKAVTWLGSDGVLWTVIGAAAIVLALRRQWRLAIYLLVTGAGALVLDPVLKSLVGRLRPVVAHPIAHGTRQQLPQRALTRLDRLLRRGPAGLPARGPRPVAHRVHRRDRRARRPDRDQPDPARRALPVRRGRRAGRSGSPGSASPRSPSSWAGAASACR